MDVPTPPTAKPAPLDWFFRVLGFVVMTALAFTLPNFPTLELDASWRMALGRFFVENRQFGTEIVFTYGPLGWAMGKTYWGSHWGLLVGWHVVQAVVFTAIVFWHAYRLTGYARVFCFVFFYLFGLSYQDAIHQIIMAYAGLELVKRSGTPWRWSSAALLLLLVILSLVKFTNLLLGFFLVLLAGGLELWRVRRARALLLPGIFLGAFIAGWALCGQNPLNLPAYFISSWQISQGYQDVMGLACRNSQLYRGMFVAALMIAYLAANVATSADRVRSGALALGALALLYLNWKHGFIRADGHQIGFYYTALSIIVTSPVLLEDGLRWLRAKRALLASAALLSLVSMDLVLPGLVRGVLAAAQDKFNLHVAFAMGRAYTPAIYAGRLEAERHTVNLEKVRATVGDASLDVLGFEQAVALYNGFNYQPRPVFQGYSAYTPYLARLNSDYYTSDDAPEFVLFKLQTLDGRLAMMDDPHVLRVLVHRYTYLFSEQGFALWRRKPGPFDAASVEPQPIRTATVRLGETVPLGDLTARDIWVEIDYRFSLIGRLRRLLLRPPMVNLTIIDENGTESVHRLPQPIGRTGFMLNPVVNELVEFMRAAGGRASRRAVAIRVDSAPQHRISLQDDVHVGFFSLRPSDAGNAYFKGVERARFHMFSEAPISFESYTPPSEGIIGEHKVMVMHAPSQMIFEVPPGTTMLQSSYGFVPTSYQGDNRTNGARFVVYWSDGNERVVLHERYLNPLARPNDRGLQSFSLKLPRPRGHVTFEIEAGENNSNAFDWTAWTGIEFK